jgi:hypothetical protein
MDDRLRVSNADRNRAAALVRAHFVAGRLTQDELDDRLAATLAAATLRDLRGALADLPGPVPPQDSRLERGYRRLLALYPARYRRVHEEEMLAVLMAGAVHRQDQPSRAEAADLIIGALRVRCQALRGGVAGWRGALAVTSAGTVLGMLLGIPFASVSQPMPTAVANVLLQARGGPAATQQQIADSYPVMARAQQQIAGHILYGIPARMVEPAPSVQTLRSEVQISILPHESVMVITAQASTGPEAVRAADAVADSYVAYMKYHGPVIYGANVAALGSTDVQVTSGLGAICGAVIGASIGAVLVIPRRRRLRTT